MTLTGGNSAHGAGDNIFLGTGVASSSAGGYAMVGVDSRDTVGLVDLVWRARVYSSDGGENCFV